MELMKQSGQVERAIGAMWIAILMSASILFGEASSQAAEDRLPPVPLPDLTIREQALFDEGRRLFEFQFSPREGLGPVFNRNSCAACHHKPTIAGHGPGYRSNMRYHVENNQATPAKLFHDKSFGGGPSETIPERARLSERKPPTLLGEGLVAAIPEEAILANEDPADRDGDGISGRAATKDGRVMRFGSQSHQGSIFEFVANALLNELGLTSPVLGFDQELPSPGVPMPTRLRIPQPNVSLDVVNKLRDFILLLAPPPRDTAVIGEPRVVRGEKLFHDLACAKCHVPSFRTMAQPPTDLATAGVLPALPALFDKELHPFSDFLLHDMGETLDDQVVLGQATSSEYRTPPLWGLRFHEGLLMHDGRGHNVEQAIVFHGGEAAGSRNRFLSLPLDDREALIDFLQSL